MARIVKWVWFAVAAFLATAALAQYPETRGRVTFAQPELDQMLAPIALYPDSLLSQIFMAATYPRELAEAASWSRANYGLRGEQAVRAVEREDWDPSVVSLVAFPQVLAMMDERRDWTQRLGDAFLDQPDQVMETVQGLRRRADASGSLRSSQEIVVQRQGYDYVIDSPSPEVVYVPYYDPRVAYGTWWWPDYQPVYWNPWPGYGYRAGYGGFGWGYGISIGSGFFYGAFDWPRRYLRYASHRPWYHHGHGYQSGHRWTHGRDYRHGRGDGRSTQWRAGDRDRDARWRDRDGRPDRRDGRAPERRDARTSERRAAIQAPATTTQGFFPPRAESPAPQLAAPQNPALRTVAPRYRSDGPRPEGRIAPQPLQPQVQPQAQAPVPQTRSAPSRPWPAAPVQVEQRRAPLTPSPVERAASVRPQVERQAAQPAPVERSAPIERASQSQSPVERSGGSRSGGRER